MRVLVTASLLAGLAYSAVARTCRHSTADQGPRRKTLGFGPVLPHAVYYSNPYQITTNGFVPASPDADPFDVARAFIEDVLRDQLSDTKSYRIRKDSYTDKTTGISHVYARQLVNGLEVADGDININIKDGVVLSYGNSFFTGPSPMPFTNPDADSIRHPHREYCKELRAEVDARTRLFLETHGSHLVKEHSLKTRSTSFAGLYSDASSTYMYLQDADMSQFRLDVSKLQKQLDEHLGGVLDYQVDHCSHEDVPYVYASSGVAFDMADLRPALLQFMMSATPKMSVIDEIKNNYSDYVEKMEIVGTDHFAPNDGPLAFYVNNVPDTVNPVKAYMAYAQVPSLDGKSTDLNLVWKFEVEMQDNWYETAVSATVPHRIISVVDWASDSPIPTPKPKPAPESAGYMVFPWGVNDPSDGPRKMMKENFDPLASPVGWHAIPYSVDPSFRGAAVRPKDFYRNTTTTWGNNVFAQENWEGMNSFIDNYRPDASDKVFNYAYNPKETNRTDAQQEAYKYINATVAQLFYTANLIHDIYYRYGFDEVSGNFQQYNFERGGAENDAVITNAQDGSGYNNANFMTPPDGQNGRMRMYLWNTALPYRDGDLEAGIVIHEYSHGLSTRLTGGPANSGCLGFGESGGMGEGWGDFLATTIRANKNYSDYPMGAWAANREGGIRNYPYSLNETINPSTYKTLDKPGYWGVHAIGEVWAQMLWLVSQRLIAVHGYSDELFPPKPLENGTIPEGDFYRPASGNKPLVPKHGNTLMFQLVISAMKLQPCRPSFFDARDAIILADQQLTGGENFCTLWKGFAERGLGPDATVQGRTPWGGGIRTNGYAVPAACQSDSTM